MVFLLQDLVTDDGSAVKFFMPFDEFRSWPLPASPEAYVGYMGLAVEFIRARNRRILKFG